MDRSESGARLIPGWRHLILELGGSAACHLAVVVAKRVSVTSPVAPRHSRVLEAVVCLGEVG